MLQYWRENYKIDQKLKYKLLFSLSLSLFGMLYVIIMLLKTPAEVFTRLNEGCSYPEIENAKHSVDNLSSFYFISFFFSKQVVVAAMALITSNHTWLRSDFNFEISIIHLSNLHYAALFSIKQKISFL